MPEQLRALAQLLREKQAAAESTKQVKIAKMIQAATGLQFLKNKVTNG